MCMTCVTRPGSWIETLTDCAREEELTIPEAVDRVVEFVAENTVGVATDDDRELIYAAVRRDAATVIETAERAIVSLKKLLPAAAPATPEGIEKL